MLKKLFIENYALIDILEIDFSGGFSVITGETGAGKSILLGALSLILGQRADTNVLLNHEKKCIVEGTFSIGNYQLESFFRNNELDFEETTILRREINQNGKSRAFINDTPVNLPLLKELGEHLVNIHSQNSIITLNERDFQMALLDDFAKIQKEVQEYREKYSAYLQKTSQLNQLMEQEIKAKGDLEYFQFLFNELDAASISEGEQEETEQRLQLLSHSEEVKTNLLRATTGLSGNETNILTEISAVIHAISSIIRFHPNLEELYNRLKSNQIDLQDITSELERIEEGVLFDPDELEKLSNRLDLIYRLEKKHRVDKEIDLLKIKNDLQEKLLSITSLDERIEMLKKEVEGSALELRSAAESISSKRGKVIPEFEKEITNTLHQLGMPDARMKVEQKTLMEIGYDGMDKLRFLFSSNKGVEMDEISRIASGGELSRLMLSMKSLISQRNLLPTIIFDEIDMGVSGEVAGKVGAILKKMSIAMQVIAITHLPQVAGMGDAHYWVYKANDEDVTRSRMKKLTREERIQEIAKMLSSEKVSENAFKTAMELLRD